MEGMLVSVLYVDMYLSGIYEGVWVNVVVS
jgi:hypothetical protein